MNKPVIFISYSHKDEKWKDRLMGHLGVLGEKFEVWTDREIGAGEDWFQKIEEAMRKANVAILLISAHFLTSKFILNEEVARLLKRRDQEGLRIMPVIVSDCAWQAVKWLAVMQARPRDGVALRQRKPAQVDQDLKEIALEVSRIIARPAK